MKVAIICANGKAGSLIAKEAVDRGLDVTAVVRGANRSAAPKSVSKDILDLQKSDLAGVDAVVDAFGAWTQETLPLHSTTLRHLCDLLAGTQTRLFVVGGAGSLFVDKEHTACLADAPDFPDAYKPVATAQGASLKELRTRSDVAWTYVSPAADFRADGPRTGKYILAGEEFTVNARGESVISYADYAVAMVDLLVGGGHVRERVSVLGE